MTTNVGNLDRAFRVWLGMLLLATPILELRTFPYSLIGLIPLITGLVGYCPVYRLFGRRNLQAIAPKAATPPPPASLRERFRHAV